MKSKLLLIRPPYSYAIYKNIYREKLKVGNKQVFPPMALMQLGAYVKMDDIDVKIIDGEAENLSEKEIIDRVMQEKPDVVGITFTTPEADAAIELLNAIRQANSRIITVAGGAHATHIPWDIASRCDMDFIVMYEGEKALRAICNNDKILLKEYGDNASYLFKKMGIESGENIRGRILLGQGLSTEEMENNRAIRDEKSINMNHYRVADPNIGLVLTDSWKQREAAHMPVHFVAVQGVASA